MDIFINKVKATETRNKPTQILIKVGDSLETIDVNIFKKLNEEQLAEISAQLNRITELEEKIKGALDV
jgi:transcriptional regulator